MTPQREAEIQSTVGSIPWSEALDLLAEIDALRAENKRLRKSANAAGPVSITQNLTPEESDLVAERDAALADAEALREHLQPVNDNGQMRCQVCHHWWYVGDPERHEEGCILRAPHPGQSRLDGLVDELWGLIPQVPVTYTNHDWANCVACIKAIIDREIAARKDRT